MYLIVKTSIIFFEMGISYLRKFEESHFGSPFSTMCVYKCLGCLLKEGTNTGVTGACLAYGASYFGLPNVGISRGGWCLCGRPWPEDSMMFSGCGHGHCGSSFGEPINKKLHHLVWIATDDA